MDKGRKIEISDGVPLLSPEDRHALCAAETGSSAMLGFTLGVLGHKSLHGGRVNFINTLDQKGKLRLIEGRKSTDKLHYKV